MKIFRTHLPSLAKCILILCSAMAIFPSQTQAKDVTFEWIANTEIVTGYRLYYNVGVDSSPPYQGTGITEGNSPISIGNATSFTATGLLDYETYHFALTAYNGAQESGYTAIVTVSPNQNPSPTILKISIVE